MAKHILAIEAQAVELWLASPEAWERMTEALHHLHSLEMWRWWEPQSDGSAIVRRGTSPDFAAVILQALRAANPSDAPLQGGDE